MSRQNKDIQEIELDEIEVLGTDKSRRPSADNPAATESGAPQDPSSPAFVPVGSEAPDQAAQTETPPDPEETYGEYPEGYLPAPDPEDGAAAAPRPPRLTEAMFVPPSKRRRAALSAEVSARPKKQFPDYAREPILDDKGQPIRPSGKSQWEVNFPDGNLPGDNPDIPEAPESIPESEPESVAVQTESIEGEQRPEGDPSPSAFVEGESEALAKAVQPVQAEQPEGSRDSFAPDKSYDDGVNEAAANVSSLSSPDLLALIEDIRANNPYYSAYHQGLLTVYTNEARRRGLDKPAQQDQPTEPTAQSDSPDAAQSPHAAIRDSLTADFDRMERALNAELARLAPEDEKTRRAKERRQRASLIVAAVADGLRALSNLYFTTQYAPPQDIDDKKTTTARLSAWFDKLEAQSKEVEKQRQKLIERIASLNINKGKSLASLYKMEQEMIRKEFDAKQKAAAAEAKAKKDELYAKYLTNKITESEYKAATAKIESDHKENLLKLQEEEKKERIKAIKANTKYTEKKTSQVGKSKSSSGSKSKKTAEEINAEEREEYFANGGAETVGGKPVTMTYIKNANAKRRAAAKKKNK